MGDFLFDHVRIANGDVVHDLNMKNAVVELLDLKSSDCRSRSSAAGS